MFRCQHGPPGCARGAACLLLAALLLLGAPATALAHKVNVFAWVEGDRVHTESRFSRGKAVNRGRIIVYDLRGEKLLEGETDAEGRFSFPAPGKAGLRIELLAAAGHRAEWTVEPEELGGEAAPPGAEPIREASAAAPDPVTASEIRRVVDQALDRKLDPVIRMLAETREPGPSVTEVLGGIGYILGLAGVAAYVQSRKRKGPPPPG